MQLRISSATATVTSDGHNVENIRGAVSPAASCATRRNHEPPPSLTFRRRRQVETRLNNGVGFLVNINGRADVGLHGLAIIERFATGVEDALCIWFDGALVFASSNVSSAPCLRRVWWTEEALGRNFSTALAKFAHLKSVAGSRAWVGILELPTTTNRSELQGCNATLTARRRPAIFFLLPHL